VSLLLSEAFGLGICLTSGPLEAFPVLAARGTAINTFVNGGIKMNAKEQAKAGLWLLKQAGLEFVKEHPGLTPNEVRDALDLYSPNTNGDHKDTLLWDIENLLAAERVS